MVEGARLESVCTPKAYRGFESHPVRWCAGHRPSGWCLHNSWVELRSASPMLALLGPAWRRALRIESHPVRGVLGTALVGGALVIRGLSCARLRRCSLSLAPPVAGPADRIPPCPLVQASRWAEAVRTEAGGAADLQPAAIGYQLTVRAWQPEKSCRPIVRGR